MCLFDAPMTQIQKLIELWISRPPRVEPVNDNHLIYIFTGLLPALRDAMPGIMALIEQPVHVASYGALPSQESNDACCVEASLPKLADLASSGCGTNGAPPATPKQIYGRKPEHLPDDLLNLLPSGGLKNTDWLARAHENGISRRTFFRLRSALAQSGKIQRSATNNQWQPIVPE